MNKALSSESPTSAAPVSAAPISELASQQQSNLVTAPTNVLVVGVGGQGVITVSKVLAQLCLQQNLQVKQSEVHGMAKRGGAVFSHVRFGSVVHSPTIPMGQADIILALEWAEGLRWLPYLNPENGTFIADTQRIVPPFSCRNRKRGATFGYTCKTVEEIRQTISNTYALDATGMATELGNARAANTVLLGTLSTALDFPPEDWQSVIEQSVPPSTIGVNREAFLLGREWVNTETGAMNTGLSDADSGNTELAEPGLAEPGLAERGLAESGLAATELADAESADTELADTGLADTTLADTELEIIDAWCKGCDICVKMCPERLPGAEQ